MMGQDVREQDDGVGAGVVEAQRAALAKLFGVAMDAGVITVEQQEPGALEVTCHGAEGQQFMEEWSARYNATLHD